jgi:hypothetical protein
LFKCLLAKLVRDASSTASAVVRRERGLSPGVQITNQFPVDQGLKQKQASLYGRFGDFPIGTRRPYFQQSRTGWTK